MFKVFDNTVPFNIQQHIYEFVIRSNYNIKGWSDRDDLDISKHDIHSKWSLQDLKNSLLYSYVIDVLEKTKNDFNFNDFEFQHSTVNLSKKSDYYYTHTHGEKIIVVLYYVNLEWKQEWAGETLFFDEYNKEAVGVNSFLPGRLIVFDGKTPHSIRPQSTIGPEYRFTIGTFVKKK
jgi:Rps23 Pro-64 3,4-dihydroxylase Tpa1-like proline 4-hydroxylase